jgi:CO/xanthine dehydrogenase FAD-binding subunit
MIVTLTEKLSNKPTQSKGDIMYYRRLPIFQYTAPNSLEEACTLLEQNDTKARIKAGGTILIHQMKERVVAPELVISLNNIPDMDYISFDASSGLKIGAMTKLQSIAESPLVKKNYGLLSEVCSKLGTVHIRNMGTLGGNITSKFPTAETVPALIALGAQAKIVSGKSEQTIPIEDLNKELKKNDILTQISLPVHSTDKKWGYEKFAIREKLDYATVLAAVVIVIQNNVCKKCTLAVGGVHSKRVKEVENILIGSSITNELVNQAAEMVASKAKLSSDLDFSAAYKKHLLKIMVKRALGKALGNK